MVGAQTVSGKCRKIKTSHCHKKTTTLQTHLQTEVAHSYNVCQSESTPFESTFSKDTWPYDLKLNIMEIALPSVQCFIAAVDGTALIVTHDGIS